jgi:hypothetical protein
LYYYSGKKKARENDVTSGHVTDVTSGHATDVTSGNVTDSSSGHVTSGDVISGDVTSGSTPFPKLWWPTGPQTSRSTDQTPNMRLPQYSHSNDEEPYYILKTNNPFLFCFVNLYTVMYFMYYSHCYCCLCHVNRIHTCNVINILIGHQLFNDDFINDGKCFTTYYQIKMVKCINDRTVLSTVDVHWWMISYWSNLSIYFSLVVDW